MSSMTIRLVFLAIILIPLQAGGQWSPDPATNTMICDVSGEQSIPKIVSTSDGGSYVCWFDNRGGSYAVYLQRLDSLGAKQWAADGLLLSSHPQNTWLTDYDMDADPDNNAVIVFSDIRNGGDFNPVIYKVSPQGVFLWGADGITLSDSASVFQPTPYVASTADGGAVVTWFYGSTPSRVAMQRISRQGQKEWGQEPILLSGSGDESLAHPSLVASDSGNVILLWCGFTGSLLYPQNYTLYTQKYSPLGLPLWGAAPDTVYNLGRVPGFFVPRIVSDGVYGALYGWHDDRLMTNLSVSYVQHLSAEGIPLFPPNGSAVSMLGGRNHFDVAMSYSPATGETFAAWTETNDLQTRIGLYGQKYSPTGARMWSDSGRALVPLSANSIAYVTVGVRDSVPLIWWNDLFSGGINNALRGMKLDRQGMRQWGDSIRTVSSAPGEKLHLATTLDARGATKLAWGDRRSDAGGIYAQAVQLDGTLGNPVVTVRQYDIPPSGFALEQCYPNPFNPATVIRFTVPPSGARQACVQIHDPLGRVVATLVDERLDAGACEVRFNASGLASGVYFYTLRAGLFRETKRMVLLR